MKGTFKSISRSTGHYNWLNDHALYENKNKSEKSNKGTLIYDLYPRRE